MLSFIPPPLNVVVQDECLVPFIKSEMKKEDHKRHHRDGTNKA